MNATQLLAQLGQIARWHEEQALDADRMSGILYGAEKPWPDWLRKGAMHREYAASIRDALVVLRERVDTLPSGADRG
jgi:hypothetical protein